MKRELLLLVVSALFPVIAAAQPVVSKPVLIMVPNAPGGGRISSPA